ncbi:bifunctional 2-polyprenyl-6-hydroxyphenol methylase/3-demethylubiquinol 3-O-methyltransferase UbiG [Dechloromonas sp. HYN0024]|uniref:class I SAM-dependent methyltransferase n=1 Tax=Dechloromonas sp. HYN0024 TaxID=2231055 RepID=UPI000E43BC6A|nr:methyltransferase domain-containing protein [Dechloromonas sp. HYN0024]AXS79203.1 methyltransferase domain-containing protein [Dechloromonas sp. HYN0024]
MHQTPIHNAHNPDLLRLIPSHSRKVIEIGCSSGALAQAFKNNANCDWFGIDIDPSYAEVASKHCDHAVAMDIETADSKFYQEQADRDCWVFGDTLEHLKDPWKILGAIREVLPTNGSVVACIPNAQHWSIIAKLSTGEFRYEDSGLMDKTHLRWFTKKTIIDLFASTGFKIVAGLPRVYDEPGRDRVLPMIGEIARLCGADASIAINDAMALQYVVRAEPA